MIYIYAAASRHIFTGVFVCFGQIELFGKINNILAIIIYREKLCNYNLFITSKPIQHQRTMKPFYSNNVSLL